MKILYVEDNQLDRDLTRRELKESAPDFLIDTVATQRDALSALEKKPDYDLVLSDMGLPDGDGLAILTHVRGRGLPVAVVIITGQGDEETAVAALKAGAQDYVVKRDGYREHLPLILRKALECYREASIRSSQLLRVLYAEPNAADVDLTRRHLSNFAPHISVECVRDASEVFRLLSAQPHEHPYEAILLDYRLPGMNALEILKKLRQESGTDAPVILITGQGDEEVAVQALKLGATDYLAKSPGYLYKLPSLLENAVSSVQLVREHRKLTRLMHQNELVLNSADEGILGLDLAGNHTFVNLSGARMLGYETSEMVGLKAHSLWHHTKIDGSHCREEECAIYTAFREGVVLHDQEDKFWRKDGTSFPAEFSLMPIREGDRLLGSVLTFRDITERKLALEEKEKLIAQLIQAQKMESVGRLAGGVAHDFNNQLSVIIGNVDLAIGEITPSNSLYENLEEIYKAARRSADIVRQLLAFARKQTVSPAVLDLNQTISGMLSMLGRLIGEDIDLAWMPEHDLWRVKIDPSQIDQILANLSVNARDAIAGVGKVTVETHNVFFDEAYCAGHPGSVPGQYVLLAVSDNGMGMGKDVLEHLFEPFFTTKEAGKGTGLGLSTVYGIVKQNEGFITVYSEPGEGTTCRIYLPRFETEAVETEVENKPETLRGGAETVLMVEDEAAILRLGKRMIESLGYTVLTANTPQEAIRLAGEHSGAIHLLLTDVVMPQMNGRELAEQLKSIHPDLKCVYMSGYTSDVIAHRGVLESGVIFIQKPFSKKDMATKVREALDKG